jgi:hypothetical protein
VEPFRIAEGQFRRAVWLNPFEYRLVCHLHGVCISSDAIRKQKIILADWTSKKMASTRKSRQLLTG